MGLSHGRQTVFKLDDLAGALQDISSFFRSASGLHGKTDRQETQQFGDAARRRGVAGLRDGGPISLGGLWKATTAAVHGQSTRIAFDQYSLVQKVRSGSVRRAIDLPETHQFGATWREREVVGLMSGGCTFAGLFNGAAGEIDAILRAALASAIPGIASVGYGGFAIGSLVDLLQPAMTNYAINSPGDNVVDVSGEFEADERVDLGVSLHDFAAETATGNGASVDETASTTLGAAAHLHLSAFSGFTNIVVKVQHSVDNSVWVDLITFAAATGPTKERQEIAVGTTINRYVRALWTFTGAGPGSSTFQVSFARRGYTYGTAGTFRHLAGLQARTLSSSFEYGPEGSTAGSRKLSGECRLSSLSVDLNIEETVTFSAELVTTGAIAEATF